MTGTFAARRSIRLLYNICATRGIGASSWRNKGDRWSSGPENVEWSRKIRLERLRPFFLTIYSRLLAHKPVIFCALRSRQGGIGSFSVYVFFENQLPTAAGLDKAALAIF
jgi:hypothetical protein